MNTIFKKSNNVELEAGELKQVSGGNDVSMLCGQSGLDEMYEIIAFNKAANRGLLDPVPFPLPPIF